MRPKYLFLCLAYLSVSCNHGNETAQNKEIRGTEGHGDHQHLEYENQEEINTRYTIYSKDLELYIEADPFVVGENSNVLAHFTKLSDFKPLKVGSVSVALEINDKKVKQTYKQPKQPGICSFEIIPDLKGKGNLLFEISTQVSDYKIEIPDITVYSSHEEAHQFLEEERPSSNLFAFTKEQSWKVDFVTDLPKKENLGQVIKTSAEVKAIPNKEVTIAAKASGIVLFTNSYILEGNNIQSGQDLFIISGNEMAENNISIRYLESKNNYETNKANFDRIKVLAQDKIVSDEEFLSAQKEYQNSKAIYDNLKKNFNSAGQKVKSPFNGFISKIFVKNGMYVEAGQPILVVSNDEKVLLVAEVQQKYSPFLNCIQTANIQSVGGKLVYSLEQLEGRISSYGKAANTNNFLIPVYLEVKNKYNFLLGSFMDVYLRTKSNKLSVTVPNTSLIEEQGNYFVYVQYTPELFEKREVKTGITDGQKTEITEGLNINERIVIKGAILIKLSQSTGKLDTHSGHVH